MSNLVTDYIAPTELASYSGHARTHSAKQVRQIAKSMKRFGFIVPILADSQNRIIAGHARLLAAKELGLPLIPVIRVDHLSEPERRAYMLADNKLTENGGWDNGLLRVELEFLMSVDFDIDLTGFSTPELNLVMNPVDGSVVEPPIPEPTPLEAVVSRLGDLWKLDRHRVACGDSRDPAVVAALLSGEQAAMAFTDPPYNVEITGHVCGNGKSQHAEFQMAAGEMSSVQFTEFLTVSLGAAASSCAEGALLYACMDWRHLPELYAACAALLLTPINLCVWVKSNGGMGSLYRSQHELVLVVKKGKAPHVNNVELGKHGRYRTNVWNYAGMNAFSKERDEALAMHPTVKPVALVADAIQDVTNHGDIVLDSFLGAGTTLIAAAQCKRRCYGIEIDPRYVDVTLKRWIALTGKQPIHVDSGMTYEQLRQSRLGSQVVEEASNV